MELYTKPAVYSNPAPIYNDPEIVGFYSVDDEGSYYPSTEKLLYLQWNKFSSKPIHFDLTVGEDDSVKRTEKNKKSFYYYSADHPVMVHEFSATSLSKAGFIFKKKVLSKIGNIPYEERDNDIIAAYLYQGNIYIHHCDETKEEINDLRWFRFSRWGHKFKQYMLSGL